jgi:hypothetical protein
MSLQSLTAPCTLKSSSMPCAVETREASLESTAPIARTRRCPSTYVSELPRAESTNLAVAKDRSHRSTQPPTINYDLYMKRTRLTKGDNSERRPVHELISSACRFSESLHEVGQGPVRTIQHLASVFQNGSEFQSQRRYSFVCIAN